MKPSRKRPSTWRPSGGFGWRWGRHTNTKRGKGEKNRETARQIGLILEMFSRHIQERKNKGKWSEAQIQNRWENMEEAFDIAISTERLKNKNE
ncbi:MAG: hypothetical protein MPW14_08990 [Candidatus Manganitrophus sp.]|nr:MAG: hypothetical protein MPW14_08990 [Candidatus Manganitrophus sp.]